MKSPRGSNKSVFLFRFPKDFNIKVLDSCSIDLENNNRIAQEGVISFHLSKDQLPCQNIVPIVSGDVHSEVAGSFVVNKKFEFNGVRKDNIVSHTINNRI